MDMTIIEDFVSYAIQAVFLYFLGSIIIGFLLHFFSKDPLTEEITDIIIKKIHFVSIEKHGEVYYWFDGKEGNFLAQGKTLHETVNHLKERFPTDVFFAKINGDTYQIGAPDWVPRKPVSVD